ncbi:MAG: GTP-binding protein [Candidatus Woesearchaeota archaeon]
MSSGKILEDIKKLEEEIRRTQYNKATQHHIGILKAKIAKLREKLETKSSGGKKPGGYAVKKTGDATAVLVGFPSVGKSTLMNRLANADSKVGAYAFTTIKCVPGVMEYKNAKIQILDIPGLIKGASSGVGRGREVISVIKNSDLIVFVLDFLNPEEQFDVLQKEIYDANIRINKKKPDITITKKARGGISISSTTKLSIMQKETIEKMLIEMKINNADVVIREDISPDDLIDVVEGNRVYIPAIVVINKVDTVDNDIAYSLIKKLNAIPISAEKNIGIENLKSEIYKKLNFIRVYTKEIGKKPDMDAPLIVRRPATIEIVCKKIHRNFVNNFKFAKVWGSSAKFPGQKVSLNHEVEDGDIIEIHLK